MFATFIIILFYTYDRFTASLWIRYPEILLGKGLQLASVRLQIILWLKYVNTPLCGLTPSRLGFPARDYLGKTLETTWFRFDWGWGWGGISPCLVLWRGTCPDLLSPMNGDLGSNQILTQYYGAPSQSVSQLESLGTTPTSKFP
jgi:hypothetical protein